MFTGDELAAYYGKIMLRVLVVVLLVGALIGWGVAKLFD
jgi:hypothetical protein